MRRDLLVPLETELLSVPELSYDDGLVVKEECDRLFWLYRNTAFRKRTQHF